MIRYLFLIIVLFTALPSIGQIDGRRMPDAPIQGERDSIPPVSAYKMITVENDTTHVDTSLTIEKMYRWNYLRQDNFELLPFSNVGRPYNALAYSFGDEDLFPEFVAGARHFNFFEVEDVLYYYVPTPYTELFFKTTFEQGQLLDARFTVNTSENLNFSLAYKGMRSLGKYRHILTSSGNFRATLSYNSPNDRYHLKTHFASQDLSNQENGGLAPDALVQYINENEEFLDRSRLEVNFEDAENILTGKRYFLKHSYDLVPDTDSLAQFGMTVGHIMKITDREYMYTQASQSDFLGPSYEDQEIRDEVALEKLHNEVSLALRNRYLGEISVQAEHIHYNYGYNTVLDLEEAYIGNRLIGDIISIGGEYEKSIGNFDLYAQANFNISGDFQGTHLEGGLHFALGDDVDALISVTSNSEAPDFNFLLYQSDYINYNWQTNFSTVKTQELNFILLSDRLLNIEADLTRLNDYTYFGLNAEGMVKPFQHEETINYFKIKAQREFRWGKHFSFNTTNLYQKVFKGEAVLHVPSFVTRNTIYFSDHWFDNALYLQTGFTLHYFTPYEMDGYDPVLAEFYVQNELEFDHYPRLDFFFNSKIERTRIFFMLEHVNTLVTGNNSFSAPLYPYRDFSIRFGLVWDFFL